MDGTFHAIATILHRVPRDVSEPVGKKAGKRPQGDNDAGLPEVPDGWVRFAL